jgi:DNA-binding XRE family transcriptional regulator
MSQPTNHVDDLDRYTAQYDTAERIELAAAEFALDVALLLHRAREQRELSQAAVAKLLGLTQQAVSRIESPEENITLATVSKYLDALGYDLELLLREPETGDVIASARFRSGAAGEDC